MGLRHAEPDPRGFITMIDPSKDRKIVALDGRL
jgi:hypothetical protein